MELAQEYFHEIDDDDISKLSSTDDNDFPIIPPDPDEMTDEEYFDENLIGGNLEIPKPLDRHPKNLTKIPADNLLGLLHQKNHLLPHH
ncbi:hypothetical protein TNCV_1823771 [Trichonephila clavipes]|nr:hypothetical protein TNCV_1823771 [Trichonephila clavipes]